MESVSIFIAPPSQRDILAALVDLSQIGVLSPFGWIEAPVNPEGAPDSEDPHLVWTVCGRMVVSTLATEIHSDEIERLRVIVLVPVGTDGDSLSDEAETFYQELNVLEVKDLTCDRIRVMVPRSKESVTPLQARAGWHNIMLSPEGASGPRFPGVPWWNDETTIPGLAAVSLAAMGGIIEGVDSAPLDHETIDASEMVRVVKSYVRMVDAKGIEDQLRQQILTVTDHFPSPMLPSKKTIDAFSDPLRESSRAANEWAKLHEAKLRRPLNTPQDVQRTQIGLLSALRQLLSFLWVSIKGAPRAWVNGKIRDLKTLTSSAATGLIFGVDSRMSVVVGGIGPDGNPSNWREMVNVAKETASEWSALPGQDHKADRRSTSAMWTTLVEGGNALLDGSGCQPLNLPAEIGYVPDRRDVAPSERDRQGVFVLDKSFGTLPAGSKFRAWDALRIQDALRVLEQVFKEGGVKASDAAVDGKRLMAWHDSNELRYLPRIGRYFRHWFDATRQEIMKDRAALEALSGEDIEEEGHRFAKSARIMKILTIVALAAVGLLVILGVFAVLGWAAVGLLAGLTTVAWIVASIIQYLRSARDFFGLMHRAQLERNTRAEIEERLRVRLDDLAALGQAYAQYEQWAEVYTEFLSDPLGQKNAAHVGGFWQASTPKNMELRMLEADERQINDVAAELRATSYVKGWVSDAWSSFRQSTPQYLSSDQRHRWNSKNLSMETEQGDKSALLEWVAEVKKSGVHSSYAQGIWKKCMGILEDDAMVQLDLRVVDSTQHSLRDYRTLREYRKDLEFPPMGQVVKQVFTPGGQADHRQFVVPDKNWYRESPSEFEKTMVLVQATSPRPLTDFAFGPVEPEPEPIPIPDNDIVF